MNWGVFWRGLCMGVADVIPGVSGGTMALILGIYGRFISAVKSLNPKPILALASYIVSGFKAEKKATIGRSMDTVDWRFLLPLGLGIFSAMAMGSVIIPTLMDNHPEIMRGLFFGLILASVGVPWRMMPKENGSPKALGLVMALVFGVFGYAVTDPNRDINTTGTWVEVQAPQGESSTLKELIRQGPSSLNAAEVYWSPQNQSLRIAHLAQDPEGARQLAVHHEKNAGIRKSDKKARKDEAKHYQDISLSHVVVQVPRPSFWFVYLAGVIAISAMVLPGISGSFLLLILGCYYFVLNAVKGTISGLLHFQIHPAPIISVCLFALGCLTGLVGFSRVLSYLLREQPVPTFGALIGLMIGCLRGVWPWRFISSTGDLINQVPETLGHGNWQALLALFVGVGIALGLESLGSRTGQKA